MCNNLTRLDLIEAAFNAKNYLSQVRGVLDSMLDVVQKEDSEENWRYCALLTLVCLACDELNPAVNARVKEPEVHHVA